MSFALLKRIKNERSKQKVCCSIANLHVFNFLKKTNFFSSMVQLGTLITKTVCPGAKQCATGTRAHPNYTPAYLILYSNLANLTNNF